ncbi:hypothetical protein M407DRAFT_113425 [Tulasnella calospora MUT 4182]|uniref:Uncharacterized protein n=1 Tax=Tulasnella calospora MUT 4182 TaxID=1051891 RepID=A0A0C3QCG5_9AGAM|nr:hypothetical protein M407DRAFT_113425 [Tulasnella calospora MUT 4182]
MDASIEDLSDEVLCQIFHLVILQPRPKPYPRPTSLAKLSQLSAVSTEWRTLIRKRHHSVSSFGIQTLTTQCWRK